MLTHEQGVEFMTGMCDAWNSEDFGRWSSFFAADFAEEEPANTPAVKAPEKLTGAWEATFGPGGARWILESKRIFTCGNEIAVYSHHPGNIGGKDVVLESIAIWTVDDDLKAHYCRVFSPPFEG